MVLISIYISIARCIGRRIDILISMCINIGFSIVIDKGHVFKDPDATKPICGESLGVVLRYVRVVCSKLC